MASEWQAAVDASLNIVRGVAGISTATWPEDSQNATVFATGYTGEGDDMVGPPGVRKSLGEIVIEVCTSAKEPKVGVPMLMALVDSIPHELLKTANYKLGGTVETFEGVRHTRIQEMPFSGYMGIAFTLYGVKITTNYT